MLASFSVCASAGARSEIVEGNRNSPVKVVIYDDLQCPDCLKLRTLLDEKILPRYGSRVAFVHKDFPLPKHDWARQAAMAARWVYEQDSQAGITFRREVMSEQDHITQENLKPWLLEFAARHQLDAQGILNSLTDKRLETLVDQDYQAGRARGVSRTPTVYVNGQMLVEIVLYDDLARAIDSALAR
jgi:protein-disulfide isomerase